MKKLSLEVLKDDKAPAVALMAVVLRQYGEEALVIQPEFLRHDIQSEFCITISDQTSDKIQAAITVLTTDFFESQHEVFETCCHLLNGTAAGFDDVMPLEAEEIATALAHYRALAGANPGVPFSYEVRAYAGIVFHNYGMSQPPTILPDAIMPPTLAENATQGHVEKDTALNDLFNAKTLALATYMESMQ